MSSISHIIYFPLGYIYLWIKYRNKEKVNKVLIEKYNGGYYDAGTSITLTFFGAILIALILGLLVAVVIGIFKNSGS